MVCFHYKNIYTALFSFLFTQPEAVQQAVPLIATQINDKALIMKIKMQCRKCF